MSVDKSIENIVKCIKQLDEKEVSQVELLMNEICYMNKIKAHGTLVIEYKSGRIAYEDNIKKISENMTVRKRISK